MDSSHPQQAIGAAAPLQLSLLTIRRFRCLHDVGPLPVRDALTVFAGENGGGKTTCIDAIATLLGKQGIDDADRSHWAETTEPIEVEGVFYALDDPERRFPVHLRVRQEDSGARAYEVLDRVHPGFGGQPANLSLTDLKARMADSNIGSPGGSVKQPYVKAAEDWLAGRPDEEFEDRWRPATKEEIGRLPRLARFNSAEPPSPITTIQQVASREFRRLLEEEPYASQLATIGAALDADVAPRLQRIKEKIEQHCADLDSVEIKPVLDFSKPTLQVQLQVCRQGEEVDLEKEGEGQRRRVALAIYEADLQALEEEAPTSTVLLAYDEPDTHLDYAAQRKLFDILERQARLPHVQVVVATHSKNFIDKVPLQALLHFRLGAERQTRVEALASFGHAEEKAFLSTVWAGLGLRTSALLDERCFLVVEGDTEEAAIPELFRLVTGQSLLAAGITLFNTKGSRSVRRVVDALAVEWNRDVVLLADADTRDDHQAWAADLGLNDGDGAHYIGSKEFEDAFSDEVWLRVLQIHFPPADGSPWTLDELAALRRNGAKYSDQICPTVKRRCRDNKIGKPDLGFALAAVCAEAEVPAPLRACLELAREKARQLGGVA